MRKYFIIPFIILLANGALNAQKNTNDVTITDLKTEVVNDYVDISFNASVANNAAKSSYTLFVVPTLTDGINKLALASIVVQGKRAQVAEKRYTMARSYPGLGEPVYTTNGQKISYRISVPFQSWMMGDVQMVMDKYSRGCCEDVVMPSDLIAQSLDLGAAERERQQGEVEADQRAREREELERQALEREREREALEREAERVEAERRAMAESEKREVERAEAERERERREFERTEMEKREIESREREKKIEEQSTYESPFRGPRERKKSDRPATDTIVQIIEREVPVEVYVDRPVPVVQPTPAPPQQPPVITIENVIPPQSEQTPPAPVKNINQIIITTNTGEVIPVDSLITSEGNLNQLVFMLPSAAGAATPLEVNQEANAEETKMEIVVDSEGDKWSRLFTFIEPAWSFDNAIRKTFSEELFDYNMPLNLTRGINRTQQSNLDRFIDENRDSALPIIFRQGSYDVERFFAYNNVSLVDLISAIRAIQSSPDSRVVRVIIAGFASPEGSFLANDRLAWERAVSVKDIILNNTNLTNRNVNIYNGSVDWRGLYRLVADSDMYHKYQVLNIIDFAPAWNDARNDNRLEQLKKLQGGEPYQYMLNHIFPLLRNTAYIKVYYENVLTPETPAPNYPSAVTGHPSLLTNHLF